MARWGNCDFRQLQRLQKNMDRLNRGESDRFLVECAKELAARLIAKVIRRTPVGQYPISSGKNGGTLRRGWTSATEAEASAGGKKSAKTYVEVLRVQRIGNLYQIEIINPVMYSSYVEFGHRTADHSGWITGQFMLTLSENELDAQAPQILEKKLIKYLGVLLDAN
jgi:hypothetical protein